MSDVSNRLTDISQHPDVAEMRERYRQILGRGQAVAVDGLVLLAGLYLAFSPWAVNFSGNSRITVENLILGGAVFFIGLGLAIAPEGAYRLSWALVAIGAWTIIMPFALGFQSDHRIWISNVIIGGLTALFGLYAAGMALTARGLSRRAGRRAAARRGMER